MRKTIAVVRPAPETSQRTWLDLDELAQVEVSSEDAAHPIEAALRAADGDSLGWRASEPGAQTIRLRFDVPQRVNRIRLVFNETETSRVQEFVLRWALSDDTTWREIVRQQYTFSPPGTTSEVEEYVVNLDSVGVLVLRIIPDISGGDARASLAECRLA
jgi:hypothetical protein